MVMASDIRVGNVIRIDGKLSSSPKKRGCL